MGEKTFTFWRLDFGFSNDTSIIMLGTLFEGWARNRYPAGKKAGAINNSGSPHNMVVFAGGGKRDD